jgi:beta-galactosidase
MQFSILSSIRVRLAAAAVLAVAAFTPTAPAAAAGREHLSMDLGWHFTLGHATDPAKDFDPAPASNVFSYFAKAGYGLGAAAKDFDDHAWRMVDLPHDWAVELPFDGRGSGSHGYKALGRNFPENSVGWYRKSFTIPQSDLGRKISIEFDGVFRDSIVWVNGFYLGRQPSGYTSFSYDLTDYLNYGGANVIAVRVDASLEEGWFYEGAGIYRHVWLTKTAPLHVARWGTFVTSKVEGNSASVIARATVANEATNKAVFVIDETILDASGAPVAGSRTRKLPLKPGAAGEFTNILTVSSPNLWSPETPYLYRLITRVRSGGAEVDRYETPFGIRTILFDADRGFFLNDKRVELKGTCNHQDHAGVGVAVPDELNAWRMAQLKKMGANALRTSHNPPTPELLDACDRLGILVMDENRSQGINPEQLGQLEAMMRRDRNHPCVILWSLGNEEWGLESNPKGTRVTQTMQTFAQTLDPTRRFTLAISGGWNWGSSISIDVMGFNYYTHGDDPELGTDHYHAKFPKKPCVASEEGSTFSTRGIYVKDEAHQHLTAYDENRPSWGSVAEKSWAHYAVRPWVAGLFTWTGFDYRGEETPFWWPAISSQFGILDTCGFPKDNFYFYQSCYLDRPVLHLFPHWNWPGREGQPIEVWCYGNCETVELFLNGQSLGRKPMGPYSHLAWTVNYAPGLLLARGYRDGKEIIADQVETTGAPAAIVLTPHKSTIKADSQDAAIITVQANDAQGRAVPTAANEIAFEIAGPARIIGVGNGDPSSQEPDQYMAGGWKRSLFSGLAQVIVRSTGQPGEITLTATAKDLSPAVLKLAAHP